MHQSSKVHVTCGARSVLVLPSLFRELGLNQDTEVEPDQALLRDLKLLSDDREDARRLYDLVRENYPETLTWRLHVPTNACTAG